MDLKETLGTAGNVLKTYANIETNLREVIADTKLIRSELADLRSNLMGMEGRISKLEETRQTISAEMRAVVAEGKAQFEIIQANTIAELRIAYGKAENDLVRRHLESQFMSSSGDRGKLTISEP